MRRIPLLLWRFASTSLSAELEYRLNFVVAALSSVLGLGVGLFGVSLFYQGGHQFAGWSWNETLAVLGGFTFLQGIVHTVLVPNLSRVVQAVQQGTLDFVLLKPVASQLWMSLRGFSPWGLPDVFLGLALMAVSAARTGATLVQVLAAVIALVSGVVTLYSLWFILGATSIWFVRVQNVTEVLRGLLEAGRFPRAAYPAALRFVFTFLVPVFFLTTVPAEALLGKVGWTWVALSVALSAATLFASAAFWRFALRYYTSASS